EQENPKFRKALRHLGEESQTLFQALQDLTATIDRTDCSQFLAQSKAVQFFLFQDYLSQFPDLQVSHAQFEEMLNLLRQRKNLDYHIKNDYRLIKDAKQFHITKISPKTDGEIPQKMLEYGGIVRYGQYQFHFNNERNNKGIPLYHVTPLKLRHRQPGDYIDFGAFSKKLRRLFIDEKISLQDRSEAIVGGQDGQVIFVLVAGKTYLRKDPKYGIMEGTLPREQDIEKVLYSEEEIITKTKALGEQLTKDYNGKNPLLIGILKGSVPFIAELIKHIDTKVELDFMVVSSYGNQTTSSGEVKILKDVDTNIEGRDVIFVEDIIDTGRTLLYLRDMFKYRKANSVKIATLFDKPEGRVVDIEADYVCYDVPNEFIVGFGLDYAEHYRNLPYVGVLKEEIYSDK